MVYYEKTSRSAAIVSPHGEVERLSRLPFMQSGYNEAWLQDILANNPALIPSSDFGDEFSSLILLGEEVPVGSGDTQGYIDNLYVTPSGNIVIVETKLFRNQESRRTVVAQIIDYAKELQKWDCQKLDAVAEEYYYKKEGQAYKVFDLMTRFGHLKFEDEGRFTDRANKSLSEAKFLLLIIGDGIRSSVQQLAEFLNDNTNLPFRLGLVEMEMYKSGNDIIIVPNILAKTAIIERTVISFSDGIQDADLGEKVEGGVSKYIRKPILSRKEFIDAFASNGGYDADEIFEFICDLDAIDGLSVVMSPTELNIKFSPADGQLCTLMTFSISSSLASMWVVPGRIKASLEKNGIFPFLADEFLEFYKTYIDISRCKNAPYDNMSGFYLANVTEVLHNKQGFIAAAEQFANAIRDN